MLALTKGWRASGEDAGSSAAGDAPLPAVITYPVADLTTPQTVPWALEATALAKFEAVHEPVGAADAATAGAGATGAYEEDAELEDVDVVADVPADCSAKDGGGPSRPAALPKDGDGGAVVSAKGPDPCELSERGDGAAVAALRPGDDDEDDDDEHDNFRLLLWTGSGGEVEEGARCGDAPVDAADERPAPVNWCDARYEYPKAKLSSAHGSRSLAAASPGRDAPRKHWSSKRVRSTGCEAARRRKRSSHRMRSFRKARWLLPPPWRWTPAGEQAASPPSPRPPMLGTNGAIASMTTSDLFFNYDLRMGNKLRI